MGPFSGILLKQDTVSGSGINHDEEHNDIVTRSTAAAQKA